MRISLYPHTDYLAPKGRGEVEVRFSKLENGKISHDPQTPRIWHGLCYSFSSYFTKAAKNTYKYLALFFPLYSMGEKREIDK